MAESLREEDGQGPSNCKDDKITMDVMMLRFGDYDNKYPVTRTSNKDQREGDNNKATVKVKVAVCPLAKTDESLRGWITCGYNPHDEDWSWQPEHLCKNMILFLRMFFLF